MSVQSQKTLPTGLHLTPSHTRSCADKRSRNGERERENRGSCKAVALVTRPLINWRALYIDKSRFILCVRRSGSSRQEIRDCVRETEREREREQARFDLWNDKRYPNESECERSK
jgi:hypothetical protein